MHVARTTKVLAAGAAVAALTLTGQAPASARPEVSDPIASGLAGPLQIDVGHRGQVYVGQAFAGVLTRVTRGGAVTDLEREQGEIAGVASRGRQVAYTFTGTDPAAPPAASLKVRFADGRTRTVADLQRFEARRNPDGRRVYGFLSLTDRCSAQVPPEIGGEPYTGIVESHPYAVANAPGGGWYVADAAANAVYRVSTRGRVHVVSVLPRQTTRITRVAAEAFGLPRCTIGEPFAFEPVPTDVEVDRRGKLVVSLLPGGPEDPTLGERGRVYRVDPRTGRSVRLAGRFLGATNVAVGRNNRIFVAELFGNRISALVDGRKRTVVEVTNPAGLEFENGRLYASVDVFADGSIVTIE